MMDPGPCTNSEPDLNLDQPTVLTPNWSFLTGTERKRNMSYTISGVEVIQLAVLTERAGCTDVDSFTDRT